MEYLGALAVPILLAAVAGYLLGSINSSILLTRLFKNKEDIRKYGSGNAGMTNVLRTVGKVPAALTFVGDFIKCVAAVLIGYFILQAAVQAAGAPAELIKLGQYAAGFACILGHIFPVYFGFRGGKGVVTAAAMIALLDWRVFLLVIATFVLVFARKRIISLASICGAVLYPVYTFLIVYFFDYQGSPFAGNAGQSLFTVVLSTAAAVCIGVLVVVMHRANIKRLKNGEEKPIVSGKKSKQ